MRIISLLVGPALGAALLATAPAAWAQTTPPTVKVANTASGRTFVDAQGMTLYVYDKDTNDHSNCNGPCAVNWPPFAAEPDAKPIEGWTIVTRDDGALQWAYHGRPLYLWVRDKKPGDTNGDGAGGVWHLAQP